MHIVLLRHAESKKNELIHSGREDLLHTMGHNTSITDRGIEQASCCRDRLTNIMADKKSSVWCSTLDRTKQTLNAAGVEDKDITFKPELNEFYNGEGEDWKDFVNRADKVILDMYAEYQKGCDVLVIAGHSRFFSMIVCRIMSFGKSDQLVVEFPNCSMSSIKLVDHLFAVYQLGDVEHLPKRLRTGVHTLW